MDNVIKFKELNNDNIVHFFSCKPFNYLNDDIKEYYDIPNNIKIVGCHQVHSNKVVNLTKDNINETFEKLMA